MESEMGESLTEARELLDALSTRSDRPSAEALTGSTIDGERADDDGVGSAAASPPKRARKKVKGRRKRSSQASLRAPRGTKGRSPGRTRSARVIPATSFEDGLELPLAIQEYGADGRIRRLTLFEQLDKSPESGRSRQMITNSSRYGLTIGSYGAEWLELTELGRTATDEEAPARERLRARFTLAIAQIEPFNLLYERLSGHRVPAHAAMRDILAEAGVPSDQLQECVDTFIVNAKFLGLLRTIGGSERLISIEQLLDDFPAASRAAVIAYEQTERADVPIGAVEDWSRICFYVTPIGSAASEPRKHSDLILASLVEPAMSELELMVVRADTIEKPGVITKQVIEHVANARLVIADLSFHNPNVFYELALRHATGKPAIHLIRKGEQIPFDIGQFRTIEIDTTDIHTYVPQIQTWRAEIATHARRALEEEDVRSGPLAVYYPEFGTELGHAA
jgi:hypothetical protein